MKKLFAFLMVSQSFGVYATCLFPQYTGNYEVDRQIRQQYYNCLQTEQYQNQSLQIQQQQLDVQQKQLQIQDPDRVIHINRRPFN